MYKSLSQEQITVLVSFILILTIDREESLKHNNILREKCGIRSEEIEDIALQLALDTIRKNIKSIL